MQQMLLFKRKLPEEKPSGPNPSPPASLCAACSYEQRGPQAIGSTPDSAERPVSVTVHETEAQAPPVLPVRTLKVEQDGTRFSPPIKPKIRIMGKWLERAGFKPGSRVQITCLAPGLIEMRSAAELADELRDAPSDRASCPF